MQFEKITPSYSFLYLASVLPLRDSGWYSCSAVSESGSILARAEINIAKDGADRAPPIIQQGPVNQTLPIRTGTSLPCQASASDEITWLKDGVPLSTLDNRRHVIDSDNTLSIKSEYYIFAESAKPTISCSDRPKPLFSLSAETYSEPKVKH